MSAIFGGGSGMETMPDIEKLRFCREEARHGFSLLALRSTIPVTCPAFRARRNIVHRRQV